MATARTEETPWKNTSYSHLINQGEIGQGAYGIVYKAKSNNEVGNIFYAVKKISVEKFKLYHYRYNDGNVDGWILQLRREVEQLKNLNNDNIVKYYHCWFEGTNEHIYMNGDISLVPSEPDFSSLQGYRIFDNFFFIQMEYCSQDLRKWLIERKSLVERVIAIIHQIFEQILKALHYIHEKNTIHRDLKPDNILIVETDQSLNIKIGDFGLATSNNELSDKGGVGTKYYRSPEMSRENDKRDFKTDVYSVGLIFLECLDPSLNDGEKRKEAFTKILHGNYTFPEIIETERFPSEVELIKNMTEVDKDKRMGAQEALKYLVENVIRRVNGDQSRNSYTDVTSGSSSGQVNQHDNSLKRQLSNKGMERVTVVDLTLKLLQEEHLVRNQLQMKDILDISVSHFVHLERGIQNGTMPPYTFFIQAIQNWVGRKGKSATIGVLCAGLQMHGFGAAKDMLMETYGENCKVISK